MLIAKTFEVIDQIIITSEKINNDEKKKQREKLIYLFNRKTNG